MNTENSANSIIASKLSTIFFYLSVLFFIIGFNFTDVPPGPFWYQQFMPNLNNQPISDITFIDSLTGWAVTGTNSGPGHINYILKTTNSGNNWNIIFTDTCFFSRVKFIDSNTGFACGGSGGGTAYLYKSTNSGTNWIKQISGIAEYEDMAVLDQNTLWVVDHDALVGGVYFTSNGGVSWTQQYYVLNQNPNHIYFFNARIGFISEDNSYVRKTTDGAGSWNLITNTEGFSKIFFVDSLTGWKFYTQMEKTTDGGLNWTLQPRPAGGMIHLLGIPEFSVINRDTIWSPSGYILYPNNQIRGVLFRSTDGGNNWLFQVPDTNIHIGDYSYITFTDKLHGWVYRDSPTGIHTSSGGDTTFYTGVKKINSEIPKDFTLKQNYPNPFNPRTIIPYNLKKAAYVKIKAYDILGREAQLLVNQKQNAGEYQVDFMGKFSASGVYFYRMEVTDDKSSLVFSETKKMLLLK